jgi:hypothetical protein
MVITLGKVKAHLRVDEDEEDEYIDAIMENAKYILTDYVKVPFTAYDEDMPGHVEQAMLLIIQNLYARSEDDPLSLAVRSLLHRERDPALA